MNTIKSKRPTKPSPMKAMRLAEASAKLEDIGFEQTRALTPDERAAWNQARRGPGRPRKPAGEKAARVLITIAPDLLAAADDYAQREGVTRAELFARGLQQILVKHRGSRRNG